MIILGTRSEGVNAIHAILGPESDLFLDIHGALAIDIATVAKTLGTDNPLTLLVTRCKDETAVTAELDRRGIPYSAVGQTCGRVEASQACANDGPDLSGIIKCATPDRSKD